MDIWKTLQKDAQTALKTNYIPPQRYGTAFHITPPVTDLRQLEPAAAESVSDLAAWATLTKEDQKRLKESVDADPYLIWQLAHRSSINTRVVHIKTGQSASISLTKDDLVWIILDEHSHLTLHEVITQESMSIKRYFVWQKAHSSFEFWGVRTHNQFLNERMNVELLGESSRTNIVHLTFGAGEQQSDIAVSVHHRARDTKTDMLVRSAAAQQHHAIYRGLIDVATEARGTNGYQQGSALLLSPRAVIDALPRLEIRTDDVRCTHGVTTTHLDDTDLFYLRSRGLDEATARVMAIKGFFHHKITIPPHLATILDASITSNGPLS